MNNEDILIISELSEFEPIAQALSNINRLKILTLLRDGEHKISDISNKLNMPMPTTTVNVKKLEESGIIECKLKAGKHGKQKLCYLKFNEVRLQLLDRQESESFEQPNKAAKRNELRSTSRELFEKKLQIPIGSYTSYHIKPEWGVATSKEIISDDTTQRIFESEDKGDFRVIWFNEGSLTYNVSTELDNYVIDTIKISLEACSEHMFFNKNWPTDISLLINNRTIATHTTSEAHLGDNRFKNPKWWPEEKPQYGEYISLEIDESGTYINGEKRSSFKLSEIQNVNSNFSLTLSVSSDVQNPRGFMIFGKSFGKYEQDLEVLIKYKKL